METFNFYLLKSVIWLTGFSTVYLVFLRNERYFLINRIFLIGGILSAIFLPFVTWHYIVEFGSETVNSINSLNHQEISEAAKATDNFFGIQNLLVIYIIGILLSFFRIIRKIIPVIRIIRKTEVYRYKGSKLIRTVKFPTSFSFISYVFVNPSVDEPELSEIVKHEQEHIRQKHWIDLLLYEILRTIQWLNPLAWFYGRLIGQNHEYLVDKHVLQNSLNPGIYRAALLNQTFSGSIIPLTNTFNFSYNKKRFDMMNHIIQSPLRKLKLLFILPVFVGIFYAFSTPEYNNNKVLDELNIINQETKTEVGNIAWVDNSVYTSNKLNKTLGIKKGDVYSQEQFDKQLFGPVIDLYLNNGYLFIDIEKIESTKSNGATDITLKIYEGNQIKIGKVEIQGNNKVSSEEILKLIPLKTGELFSKAKLHQSYQTLVETGKFVSEKINPDVRPHVDQREVDIIFNVTEK